VSHVLNTCMSLSNTSHNGSTFALLIRSKRTGGRECESHRDWMPLFDIFKSIKRPLRCRPFLSQRRSCSYTSH